MNHRANQLLALVVVAIFVSSGIAMAQETGQSTRERSLKQDTTMQGSSGRSFQGTQDTLQGYPGRSWQGKQDTIQGSSRNTLDTVGESSDEHLYEPDNTGVNKRDRQDTEVTADEQGQSTADIEITRKIRRAIRENDSLSTYAQNIKIITKNGMVTLKGPVHSEHEKSTIEAKAAAVAGKAKVKNEIEIKAAKQGSKND